MNTQQTLTPSQIYEKCPQLLDVVSRLEDSEKAAKEFNNQNKGKTRKVRVKEGQLDPDVTIQKASYSTRFPDHFRIIAKFQSNGWDEIPSMAKSGKSNFEDSLTSVYNRHQPKGLRITLYKGQEKKSTAQDFDFWLVDSPENDPDIQKFTESSKNSNLGGGDDKLAIIEKKLDGMFAPAATAGDANTLALALNKADFQKELTAYKHEQEILKVKADYQKQIDELKKENENLESQVDELSEQLLEQEEELLGAADLLEKKIEPPAGIKIAGDVLGSALLKFANDFVIQRPEIRKFIGEATMKKFLDPHAAIAATPSAEEASNASFSPVENPYPHQTDPTHIESVKIVCEFINQLSYADFQYAYPAFFFFTTKHGALNHDHVKILLEAIEAYESTHNS